MKITLDLDKLLEEGKINQAEYEKFSQFAARDTGYLAFNILLGFGVIAVSGAVLALLPNPLTAVIIGALICAIGIGLEYTHSKEWRVLANTCILVGALLFGGGIIAEADGSVDAFLVVAVAFASAGVIARSALLTVMAVLAVSSCFGARTGYLHATYFLGIQEPAMTVVFFSIFSIALYQLAKHLAADYQRLAIAASRTGVFLVNFGFWIGSLWGDHYSETIRIADWVFALLWALALLAAGIWAWQQNRRWLVNVVAVFAAIHFYTQWFERLGASPETILVAGLLALGLAIGLHSLNSHLAKETSPS